MDGTSHEIVIPFVSRKREKKRVRGYGTSSPVVISEGGKEAVDRVSLAVRTDVRRDEIVVILSDIPIDRGVSPILVIIVPRRYDEVRIKALDEGGNIGFGLARASVVTYNCKMEFALILRGERCATCEK
jgi:hypothetical protein